MMQILLIGLGAGAASALLFASVASGSLLAILLFYLAPLPILIAAIGWSHWAALIAGLTAACALALVFGSFFFIAFLLGVGLPAWWLGYLALLARPAPDDPARTEWYPAGRLVIWAALVASLVVIVAIPNFGSDEESFRAGLRAVFERVLRAQGRLAGDAPLDVSGIDIKRLIEFLANVIPYAAAVLATTTNCINLWLAGRVVKISGNLRRPWPELPDLRFPAYAPAGLAVAIAGCFIPGLIGTIAGIVAASLLMAYALLGFAVAHAITRAMGARGFILGGCYVAVFIFGWPILLMTLIGLAETAFDIRRRAASRRGPPATGTQ